MGTFLICESLPDSRLLASPFQLRVCPENPSSWDSALADAHSPFFIDVFLHCDGFSFLSLDVFDLSCKASIAFLKNMFLEVLKVEHRIVLKTFKSLVT